MKIRLAGAGFERLSGRMPDDENDSRPPEGGGLPLRKMMAGRRDFLPAVSGGMGMDCPRCGAGLAPGKHDTGIAWRCLKCGGESLNFSQFRRMIPDEQVDVIWWTAKERPVAAPGGTVCPECRRPMLAVLIPHREEELELDICQGCQRLWRDGPRAPKASRRLDIGRGASPKPPVLKVVPRRARPGRRAAVPMTGSAAEGNRSSLITLLAGWGRFLVDAFRR